jgi:hypothetical protein
MKIVMILLCSLVTILRVGDIANGATKMVNDQNPFDYKPWLNIQTGDESPLFSNDDKGQTYVYQGEVHPRQIEKWNEIGREFYDPWCEIFYENPNPFSSVQKATLIVDVRFGFIEAYTYLDQNGELHYLHFSVTDRSYTFRKMTESQRQTWLKSYEKIWHQKKI